MKTQGGIDPELRKRPCYTQFPGSVKVDLLHTGFDINLRHPAVETFHDLLDILVFQNTGVDSELVRPLIHTNLLLVYHHPEGVNHFLGSGVSQLVNPGFPFFPTGKSLLTADNNGPARDIPTIRITVSPGE